jgi:hypothetical protein
MLKPPRSPRLTAVELYSLSFELNSLPALSLELSAFIPFHLQLLSLTPAYAQDAKLAKKRSSLELRVLFLEIRSLVLSLPALSLEL